MPVAKSKQAKVVTIRFVGIIVGFAFGILITAQWRSLPLRVSNPIAPYSSLKETRDELYLEQKQLRQEIADLQNSIAKIQKDNANVTLSSSELSVLNTKKAQAGLTKINGIGVIISYDDSKTALIPNNESVVHAADLRDTVNLLWQSGAEAISVNSQRIVVGTAIDCIGNTILVNNTRIGNPFRIEAVGDQNLMHDNLTSSAYLAQIHERKKSQGLVFDIEKNNNITVPAFDGSFEVKTEKVL